MVIHPEHAKQSTMEAFTGAGGGIVDGIVGGDVDTRFAVSPLVVILFVVDRAVILRRARREIDTAPPSSLWDAFVVVVVVVAWDGLSWLTDDTGSSIPVVPVNNGFTHACDGPM